MYIKIIILKQSTYFNVSIMKVTTKKVWKEATYNEDHLNVSTYNKDHLNSCVWETNSKKCYSMRALRFKVAIPLS